MIETTVEELTRFCHNNSDSNEDSFEQRPLCTLLEQNRPFNFDEKCLVTHVYLHGAIDVEDMKTRDTFEVNGRRLKYYWGTHVERDKQSIDLRDV